MLHGVKQGPGSMLDEKAMGKNLVRLSLKVLIGHDYSYIGNRRVS
jgi:hypothetical protein